MHADMSYDFNYQQARVLKEEMKVMPGDSLIVKCGYDSTKRKMPTFVSDCCFYHLVIF